MSYLVIGSSSFLGKNLIQYLNQKNLNTSGISRSKPEGINFAFERFDDEFDLVKHMNKHQTKYVFFTLNSYYKKPTKNQKEEMHFINYELPIKYLNTLKENDKDTVILFFSSYFNFMEVPEESQAYKETKLMFSKYLHKNNTPNSKELITSDIFGLNDHRNKIFNILIKNVVDGNSIEVKNKENFVNLVYIQKLLDFSFDFIMSNNKSDIFLNPHKISIINLYKLIKDIDESNLSPSEYYLEKEDRLKITPNNYPGLLINDISYVINEYKNEFQ